MALARAAAEAATRSLNVEWVHADLLAEPPARHTFDLVTAHFMHLPTSQRESLYAALAEAVAPGGTLLLVGHHPSDLHTTMGRPPLHDMFFTPEQLAANLDPEHWEVVVAEARTRGATDPQGQQVAIRDTVLRAVRRPGGAEGRSS